MRGRKEVMKMSGKGKGQLGYGERETIERLIMRKESISGIGRAIGRSPSTVEREIKRNGTDSPAGKLAVTTRSICVHQNACAQVDLCGKGCLTPCRKCKDFLCNRLCPEFEAVPCPLLEKPPYCCNGCIELYGYGCTHPYHFYDAKAAHEKATDRKVASRMGIDCTPEELAATTAIVKKGLAQGQSIRHIFAANEGKMCCSWRTYYDYVEDGLIEDVSNIHLPRKVRYRKRKKGGGAGARHPQRGSRGPHVRRLREAHRAAEAVTTFLEVFSSRRSMSWKLVRLNRIVRIACLSTPWRPTTQSISTADSHRHA